MSKIRILTVLIAGYSAGALTGCGIDSKVAHVNKAPDVDITEPTDCRGGTAYASPADENGDPTDACYSYAGCEPPLGWVACDPDVALTIQQCAG